MEFLLANLQGHPQGEAAILQDVVCPLTRGIGEQVDTVVSRVSDFSMVNEMINHLDQHGCPGREGELWNVLSLGEKLYLGEGALIWDLCDLEPLWELGDNKVAEVLLKSTKGRYT